jgi:hypothetical protein
VLDDGLTGFFAVDTQSSRTREEHEILLTFSLTSLPPLCLSYYLRISHILYSRRKGFLITNTHAKNWSNIWKPLVICDFAPIPFKVAYLSYQFVSYIKIQQKYLVLLGFNI